MIDRLEEIEARINGFNGFSTVSDIRYLIARVREAEGKLSHAAQCLDTESDEAEAENARLRAEGQEAEVLAARAMRDWRKIRNDTTEKELENARLRARVEELTLQLSVSVGNLAEYRARVEELEGVIRNRCRYLCDETWTGRGLHSPDCLVEEVED